MEGNLQRAERPHRRTLQPPPFRPAEPVQKTPAERPVSDRVEYEVVAQKKPQRRPQEAYVNPAEARRMQEKAAEQARAEQAAKAARRKQFEEERALPKVMISGEAAASAKEAQKWERAQASANESADTMRFRGQSAVEREHGARLIQEFETTLRDKRRPLTEQEMDAFAEKFSTTQKSLEHLQEEARFLPHAKVGPQDARLITDVNFEMIRRLEDAIHASKFPRQQALAELAHGKVTSVELEAEERGKEAEEVAESMSQKIAAEYGASPEDLIQGRGPLGKRLKFTFKNWMARISGQETDFDRWQRAEREKQSAELARNERLPHERKQRFTEEEKHRQGKIALTQRLEQEKAASKEAEARLTPADREWKEMIDEEVAEQKKPKTIEVQPEDVDVELIEARKEEPAPKRPTRKEVFEAKNKAAMEAAKQEAAKTEPVMTVEKAAKIVPYSSAMWDNVKAHLESHPQALAAFPIADRPDPLGDPVTNYVLLVARYLEENQAGNKEAAKRSYNILKAYATALGIIENAMLTAPKNLKGSEMVAGKGMIERAKKTAARASRSGRFSAGSI